MRLVFLSFFVLAPHYRPQKRYPQFWLSPSVSAIPIASGLREAQQACAARWQQPAFRKKLARGNLCHIQLKTLFGRHVDHFSKKIAKAECPPSGVGTEEIFLSGRRVAHAGSVGCVQPTLAFTLLGR